MTKPFTNRLKKNGKININDQEYMNCFEQCKTALCNGPVLQYLNFKKEFVLMTNASN